MTPQVTSALADLHRRDNPRAERTALLLPEGGATFALQVERVLRESGGTKRRAFRDPAKLSAWLGEVLTADESAALPAFLERSGGVS